MFAKMRPFEEFRRIVVDISFHAHVFEKGPHAAQDTSLRRGSDAVLVKAGGKILKVCQLHLLGPLALRVHIAPQPIEVVDIGLDGVGGVVAVQLEIALVRRY